MNRDLIRRILHARNRQGEAFRLGKKKLFHNLLGIDFSKQTEIQYVELGFFKSKIISKKKISEAQEIKLKSEYMDFEHSFDSKYIIKVSNVVVNTETNHIYVCGNNRNDFYLLKESVSWPTEILIINTEKPSKRIKQVVDNAKIGLSNSGYFHWLSEDLPNYFLDDSKYDCLAYKESKPINYSVLEKQRENILSCNKWVFVKELSFVTRFGELGYIHPSCVATLKKYSSSLEEKEYSYEKIYVSRTKTRRSIKDENLVEDYLSKRGFIIIHSEDLSFEDQVKIFAEAKIVVGLHGAGLTNTIWSKDILLVEIMPVNRINRCFEWQVCLSGGKYEKIYFNPNNNSFKDIITALELLDL
jgi:hypothetical protein